MKRTHVLFGRHLLSLTTFCLFFLSQLWHAPRRPMLQCCDLNLITVSCGALLPGTLKERQGEGSLDLDCVACSCYIYHQVWKNPRRTALNSPVIWKVQSPDLSANIRLVPVQLKGMLRTVNTSWSLYTFLGRCTVCHLETMFDLFSHLF